MEYVYAALLLHKLKQDITEDNVTNVIKATGSSPDAVRIKALVAALGDVDIEEALKAAPMTVATTAAAPTASGSTTSETATKKQQMPKRKPKRKKKKHSKDYHHYLDNSFFISLIFYCYIHNRHLHKIIIKIKICLLDKCKCGRYLKSFKICAPLGCQETFLCEKCLLDSENCSL